MKLLIETFPTHIRFEIFMIVMPLKCWNLAAKNYAVSHHQRPHSLSSEHFITEKDGSKAAQHLPGIRGKFPDAYINIAIVNEKTIEM